MLAIWSLIPLPFLNSARTSGSSRFKYRWSLPWRILSKILLAYESVQLYGSLNIFGDKSIIVQLLSRVQLFATPWTAACQASLSFAISWGLLKLMSIEIQPSHLQSPPSPLTLSLSQPQGLFQWVSSSHKVASASASALVLPVNIQDWFPLGLTGLISLKSTGLSRAFSDTTIQKHHSSALSLLYGPTLTFVYF